MMTEQAVFVYRGRRFFITAVVNNHGYPIENSDQHWMPTVREISDGEPKLASGGCVDDASIEGDAIWSLPTPMEITYTPKPFYLGHEDDAGTETAGEAIKQAVTRIIDMVDAEVDDASCPIFSARLRKNRQQKAPPIE